MPIHGYLGGVISATAPTISPTSASGVWTLDDQLQNAANWPSQSNIARSLRFNSADSAYLNRTPGSAGNQRTWTWSGWVKRSKLGVDSDLFGVRVDGNNQFRFWFTSGDKLDAYNQISGVTGARLLTTQVFRDVSAWYHFVLVADTTNATAGNRLRLYVNGSEITAFDTDTQPTQNYDTYINTTNSHGIGFFQSASSDYYLADVYFIDGQALTPSSFGYTDSNGIWQPMSYTGTYGTNGFWLNFDDNSGTTSTTLGKDSSGNGNNWTPNNFSVTAGVDNDSLVDSPTNYGTDTGVGGEVRGNYATLNPLSTTAGTYTQGNLRYAGADAWRRSNGTIAVSTGKWYWEVTLGSSPFTPRSSGSAYNSFGFGLSTVFNSTTSANSGFTDAVALNDSGYYTNFAASVTDGGTAFSSGDVLSVAVDLDANTFTFRRNNTQIATGTIGGTAGRELVPMIVSYSGLYGVMDCNFGQRPFAYTAPAGFKALCSTNLPTPTIQKGASYFNPVLYTGNGNTTAQAITGTGFQPDWVWIKSRSNTYVNLLFDAVRGAGKQLISELTNAESTVANFVSFDSDGFTVNANGGASSYNANGATYVAWQWKANGAGSSNTAGSITSTVSANQTAGFSVVRWDGNGAGAAATIGHGLGAVPKMIINKGIDGTLAWSVYHASVGNTARLLLNSTDAVDTNSGYWNNTTPTSTVFTVGNIINQATPYDYVAYCFAEIAGYSAFGSYTGNGSTDGPFIYTGFRPAYVLIKCSNVGTSNRPWVIKDKLRAAEYNPQTGNLYTNLSNAEDVEPSVYIDFVSNGFKIRGTYAGVNASSDTYIYAAFAENPFKIARAR